MKKTLRGVDPRDLKDKRVFVLRWGAFGDQTVMTPFLRWLRGTGATVIMSVSERGSHILHGNPNVDIWDHYASDSVPEEKLRDYFEELAVKYNADYFLNFCGSIEHALSPHPADPAYNWPKQERTARCDKNYYEYMFEYAGVDRRHWPANMNPELFFTEEEKQGVKDWIRENVKPGERLMTVCWTGSGKSKMYPYMEYVVGEILMRHPELVCVVVGQVQVDVTDLHKQSGGRICSRMTKWSFREAAVAVSMSDVFVSMDTGLLHASGCFDVPKVGIIGHNTVNNLTKNFRNDFSLEADPKLAECAPCHRIIYEAALQCPLDPMTHGTWCMAFGIPPEKVVENIEKALEVKRDRVSQNGSRGVSRNALAIA